MIIVTVFFLQIRRLYIEPQLLYREAYIAIKSMIKKQEWSFERVNYQQDSWLRYDAFVKYQINSHIRSLDKKYLLYKEKSNSN